LITIRPNDDLADGLALHRSERLLRIAHADRGAYQLFVREPECVAHHCFCDHVERRERRAETEPARRDDQIL